MVSRRGARTETVPGLLARQACMTLNLERRPDAYLQQRTLWVELHCDAPTSVSGSRDLSRSAGEQGPELRG
jgi:hypothetical protein